MQTLQQFRFYDLGAKLAGIFNVHHHARVGDMFGPLTDAQKSLDALIKGDPIALKFAKPEATKLLAQISALFDKYFIDQASHQLRFPAQEAKVDPQELALVELALQKFESALAAELSRMLVFPATQRGIYNAVDLLENAHRAVPDELHDYVPLTARRELDAAGRALSFDLGTAAALHTLRALEIVVAAYYELYAAPLTARTERNLATYLRKLNTLAEDETTKVRPDYRLVQFLTQIKESYRNPMVQAETVIATGSASTLFGLVTGAITQLAEHIAAQKLQGKSAPVASSTTSKPNAAETTVVGPIEGGDEEDAVNTADDDDDDEDEGVYDFRVSQAS